MTTPIARRAAILMTLAVMAETCLAQAPADSLGWRFTGALGYVQTSGNTRLSTVNLSDKLILRPSQWWTFTQSAGWIWGKTNGVESANQLVLSARADYHITPRLSAFALTGFERNRYAGIGRRLEESAGLSWFALKQSRAELQIDLGAGFQQDRDTAGLTNSFSIARLAPRFRYQLGERAYFEEQLEFVENLEDTGDLRTVANTSLVAPLTRAIALRFGYLVRYDAVPPAGSRKVDTTFTSGIQISL